MRQDFESSDNQWYLIDCPIILEGQTLSGDKAPRPRSDLGDEFERMVFKHGAPVALAVLTVQRRISAARRTTSMACAVASTSARPKSGSCLGRPARTRAPRPRYALVLMTWLPSARPYRRLIGSRERTLKIFAGVRPAPPP